MPLLKSYSQNTEEFPPAADEVDYCPPHQWAIDEFGQGKCTKCHVTFDFAELNPGLYKGGHLGKEQAFEQSIKGMGGRGRYPVRIRKD